MKTNAGWEGMTMRTNYENQTISFDPITFRHFLDHRNLKISVPDLNERDLAFPMARTIEKRLSDRGFK